MTGVVAALAVLVAMGALGVVALRRGRQWLDPLEQVAYGIPLGIVAASLVLLALASFVGLSPAVVVFVGVASGVGAWAIRSREDRSQGPEARRISSIPLLPALVLGVFIIRWAVLWATALTFDDRGLWAGQINLWGDWSQHLGDVSAFAFGDNFPPQQPRLVGHPFAYHYLTSVTAAAMVVVGMEPTSALPLHSFLLSGLVLLGLYAFAKRLTQDANIAALAAALFLLGGGFGWWIPVSELAGGESALTTLAHPWDGDLQKDGNFLWPNLYFDLIAPQRSYLYGLPLGLLTLTLLFAAVRSGSRTAFAAAGVVAGLLPFAHLGTFLALVLVVPFLFLLFPSRGWVPFGLIWVALAAPQILFQQGGGAGALAAARFQPGWIAAPDTWGWFWLKNLGLFVPLLAFAFLERQLVPAPARRFLIAFMPIFVIANLVVLQPWDWDNTKILTYWFLAVCILVAAVLARAWRASRAVAVRVGIGAAVATMVLSGLLLNLDQLLGGDRHLLLSAEEVVLAERARADTPERSTFAVGLQHNHPIPVLAGRRVLMSYPGWLWSQGMDYTQRAADLRTILALAPEAPELLESYGIDYVVVGPNERDQLGADLTAYQARYPSIIRTAHYEVFDVKETRPSNVEPGH